MGRVRSFVSLAGLVTLVIGPFVSCGGEDKFELTLRNREDGAHWPTATTCTVVSRSDPQVNRCESEYAERSWRAPDGTVAVSRARTGVGYFDDHGASEVVCNGRRLRNYWYEAVQPEEEPVADEPLELHLRNGNTLVLRRETGVWVETTAGDAWLCVEITGRWAGSVGELKGRTGTYRLVYDSIQTVLHLVED